MPTYLALRRVKSTLYPFFRCTIPLDLREHFQGTTKFELSLKSATTRQSRLLGYQLKYISEELFDEIRRGMKDLTLEDIKEILRVEVRKQILHVRHYALGRKELEGSRTSRAHSHRFIADQEVKRHTRLKTEQKAVFAEEDAQLSKILGSMGVECSPKSLDYKRLRQHFIDLHLLKYDWMRQLLDSADQPDEEFQRQVEEQLGLELFPQLQATPKLASVTQIPTPVTPTSPPPPTITAPVIEQESQLPPLQNTPLSKCIQEYLEEKNYRERSQFTIAADLNILLEEFGDIPIGRIDKQKANQVKNHIRKLPRNRSKMPAYREMSYHDLVRADVPVEDRISIRTVNKTLSVQSTFMNWCERNGYADKNFFYGVQVQQAGNRKVSEERDAYTEQQIKLLFSPKNYLPYTKPETKNYLLYWVPLIGLFSGARLNEICQLYTDNIRPIQSKSGNEIWCFDITDQDRPDKSLKTRSSRRIIPVHDTLIELGLIDFVQTQQKQCGKKGMLLFESPTHKTNSFWRTVSRSWNQRYLKEMKVKTSKLDFHSFRHTVANTLKQAGVQPHFINEMLGHSQGNIDLDRYGKAYNPEVLHERCMKNLIYETSRGRRIDFSGLKVDWSKL